MGFGPDDMTAHGFRSTASSLLNESGKWSADAIERALSHADGNQVRAAYHRGAHWQERVEMARWWSDHLDTLQLGLGPIRGIHGTARMWFKLSIDGESGDGG